MDIFMGLEFFNPIWSTFPEIWQRSKPFNSLIPNRPPQPKILRFFDFIIKFGHFSSNLATIEDIY